MTRATGHEVEEQLRAQLEQLRETLPPERGQALCRDLVVATVGPLTSTSVIDVLARALWASFRQLVEDERLSPKLLDAMLHKTREVADETRLGPAVSRWHRRRGGGPRGIVIHDDFDDPLPEFDGD